MQGKQNAKRDLFGTRHREISMIMKELISLMLNLNVTLISRNEKDVLLRIKAAIKSHCHDLKDKMSSVSSFASNFL